MKRHLVKAIIAQSNIDKRYNDRISIYDGTGAMTPNENGALLEVSILGEVYYCPFIGCIHRNNFPELQDGEITDENIIKQIKEKIR